MDKKAAGFTLVELLIAVAVVGVLTAIALPAYKDYVQRARLSEAFAALGGVQLSAEQYWANNRSYVGLNTLPAASVNFSYALSTATVSAFTVTATGTGNMASFRYSIDQNGSRATLGAPAGWTLSASCWVDRKGGQCTQ
ncbi:MAG: type IV pilin protein [Pseudomonadota bacterium]